MEPDEDLTKVHIDLPNHWATGGESMWARALGNDLYELRNVPFHAYGLNYLDIVHAVPLGPGLKPEVLSIVRPSGHTTFRVIFTDLLSEQERVVLLEKLARFDATYECADESYCAIDVAAGGNTDATRTELDRYETAGILSYETCEARVPGSFDDKPERVSALN